MGAMTAQTAAPAQTLDRGLVVLEAVAAGVGRLDELAAQTGLSRSTVHRLLQTLAQRDLVQPVKGDGWRLGFKVIELGAAGLDQIDPAGQIQGLLEQAAAELGDSVHLGVLDGADLVYLAKARGGRGVELLSRPGARCRAQNTAMGKVLLAGYNAEQLATVFDPNQAQTSHSIRKLSDFQQAIAQSLIDGYAIDDQENEPGIACLAVPVVDADGRLLAAMSCSAPTVHLPTDRHRPVAEVLRRYAQLIGRSLAAQRRWSWPLD
jgi:IclR family acetate operon transcriptional repressor